MAVLHQLNQEPAPIRLQELLEKLGSNYTERSVRRWLAEMIREGLVEKLGNKHGTKPFSILVSTRIVALAKKAKKY